MGGPEIVLVTSERDFEAVLKKRKITGYDHSWLGRGAHATVHSFEAESGQPVYLVCAKPPGGWKISEIASTFAHEATHVVQGWMKWIHEDNPAIEQYAYAVDRVTEWLVSAYLGKHDIKIGGKK